jgi:hypothetical protein
MSNLQNDGQNLQGGQTIIINQNQQPPTNGIGTAGFVLALLGLVFFWIPGLNWTLWVIGVILSGVGVFKIPKGLSIAGLCISFIGLILILIFMGALFSILTI